MTLWSALLLSWLLLVWWLWVVACSYEVAAKQARSGVPKEHRRGVSILPVFPLFPLIAWGLAGLLDRFFNPYGTVAIAVLHGIFGIALGISIVRDRSTLKTIEGRA
jgi:hypothetical protein